MRDYGRWSGDWGRLCHGLSLSVSAWRSVRSAVQQMNPPSHPRQSSWTAQFGMPVVHLSVHALSIQIVQSVNNASLGNVRCRRLKVIASKIQIVQVAPFVTVGGVSRRVKPVTTTATVPWASSVARVSVNLDRANKMQIAEQVVVARMGFVCLKIRSVGRPQTVHRVPSATMVSA